jgi:hypothetical protein
LSIASTFVTPCIVVSLYYDIRGRFLDLPGHARPILQKRRACISCSLTITGRAAIIKKELRCH